MGQTACNWSRKHLREKERDAGVNAISQFTKGDYPAIAGLRDFGRIVKRPVKLHWIPREIGAAHAPCHIR